MDSSDIDCDSEEVGSNENDSELDEVQFSMLSHINPLGDSPWSTKLDSQFITFIMLLRGIAYTHCIEFLK